MEKKKNSFRVVMESIEELNSFIRSSDSVFSDSDLKNLEIACSVLATTCRTTSFFNSLRSEFEK